MKADLKKFSLRAGMVLALAVASAGAFAQGGSRASNNDDEAPDAGTIDQQTGRIDALVPPMPSSSPFSLHPLNVGGENQKPWDYSIVS